MIFNSREGQGECRIAEVGDQAVILLQGNGGRLPAAPRQRGRLVHRRIRIEQQIVVRGDCVADKRTTAQWSQEHLVAFGKQLPGTAVVVEIELALPEREDPP